MTMPYGRFFTSSTSRTSPWAWAHERTATAASLETPGSMLTHAGALPVHEAAGARFPTSCPTSWLRRAPMLAQSQEKGFHQEKCGISATIIRRAESYVDGQGT